MVAHVIMKPKEPKPYSGRDTSGKYEHAAPLPQWLKTLEERYQRIHEKILCTPSPKAKYSKDGRLLRPKIRLHIPKSKSTLSNHGAADVKEQTDETHTGIVTNDDNNNNLFSEKDQYVNDEERHIENVPSEMNIESHEFITSRDVRRSSQIGSKRATNKGPKTLNTSNSRVSGKTSKSCPAVVTSSSKPLTRAQLQRSKTTESLTLVPKRHSKTLMSLEAINILKDMLPDSEQSDTNDKNSEIEETPNMKRYIPNKEFINYTDANNGFTDECPAGPVDGNSDKDYLTQSGGSRFPEIRTESAKVKALNQLRQMQCRVPGVGKYEISIDNIDGHFEITPPGFDVRYTSAVNKEPHEELEIPHPDIKAQAIAKCTDWLSRCTSTNNLKGDT